MWLFDVMLVVVLILIAIGLLLYLINHYVAPKLDPKILTIINIFCVVVAIVLCIVATYYLWGPTSTVHILPPRGR
jgi:hypothetical protein